MIRAENIEELYGAVNQLLVEVICPKCGNIYITIMSQGKSILAFGCRDCGDIEESALLQMNVSSTNDIVVGCTSN